MDLIHIVVYLVIIGIGLFVVNKIDIIDPPIKKWINIVVLVCVGLWLLLDVFVPLLEDATNGSSYHHRL